jgi:outer membrane protein OmpA-like peptidoglycan-associated protein/Tol biopolymer transport system component
MKNILKILLLLLLNLMAASGLAQSFHTSSSKAMKQYNEGVKSFDYFYFDDAERYLKEAISIDKDFYEAYVALGDLLIKQHRFAEAASCYRNAVRIDSLFYKPVFFNYARAEMMSGDYASALMHYKVYLEQKGMSKKNSAVAAFNIKNCEFAIEAVKNPVPFSASSVGKGINTTDDEYWPSITADGETMMFTRQANPRNTSGFMGLSQEDFYISRYSDNKWQQAYNAGAPLNTIHNEGAQSLSSDGSYMFFAACDRSEGLGSCDIYFSRNNGERWSKPVNLQSPVNTPGWESQPSISSDGKTLFFSSNRPGGMGGKDIWFSRLNDQNKWQDPVNPGSSVNTSGDEMSPFIHFDGRTLYFASDGREGMGGFDIFVTRLNSDSTWSVAENLGYPINTYNDEMGLVIESQGKKAYFSSVRDLANGKDIFFFELYEEARPTPVSYLKGKVFDKETGKMLKADYELINLSTGKITIKNSTDDNGNFLVCLPFGNNYGINISKPGYLFYSESFMFEGIHSVAEPYVKRIYLSPIKVGETMRLANVFYEIDSWELKKESITELDNLADLLMENKNLVLEIGGYTDSTGTDEHNLLLSSKRALSVVNYLVKKGINPGRLRYKGYGNSSPVGSNVTEEGRRLNRRTEAKVLELKK